MDIESMIANRFILLLLVGIIGGLFSSYLNANEIFPNKFIRTIVAYLSLIIAISIIRTLFMEIFF